MECDRGNSASPSIFDNGLVNQFSPTRSNVQGGGGPSASAFNLPFSQYMNHGNGRTYQYGMPSTMMQVLQSNPSLFSETAPDVFTPNNQHLVSGSATRNNMSTLTNASLISMRQQMDESNHDLVNMLTKQIGTIFNCHYL
jgi:hypothetical protein